MYAVQIAALMTCLNRKDTILACLRELMSQAGINDTVKLQIYLVDAGSTDGTIEAIQEHFPDIHLIRSDSGLFWCGGMRVAFDEAMKGDHDYFLWLNDDTVLLHNALQMLLDTERELNCVLIVREVVESVGNLSPEFTPAIGDNDYGLRASAKGIGIWIAPTYIGECSRNPLPPWTIPEVSLKKRLEFLHSPKGPPPREYLVFIKRHTGIYWPVYFLELYMRVLFPRLWRLFGK